jgi:hypothetical protein
MGVVLRVDVMGATSVFCVSSYQYDGYTAALFQLIYQQFLKK